MASCAIPTWLSVFGILTYHMAYVYGVVGPYCYACEQMIRPQECATAIQCSSDQKCFSRRYIGFNRELYKLGCIDKDVCQQKTFTLIGRKRKVEDAHALSSRQAQHEKEICIQCCDGEYCNKNLCGSLSTSNLRRCFECKDVQHPNDCDKVVECGRDHYCYVHRGPNHATFDYTYDMGCMPIKQCTVAATHMQNTGCMACCNDRDYCNLNACDNYTEPITTTTSTPRPVRTTVTTAPPPAIVLMPGPTAQAQYGNNVFANCITDPGVLSVTWGFNNSALPKGARTDKGGLWIDHINEKSAGVYKCFAVGQSGTLASKQITISILQAPAIALYIIRQPSGKMLPSQSFSLTCKVAGYPVPTINWTFANRNGVTAMPGTVTFSQDKHVLTIDHYSAMHNDGDYTCHATNSFGVSVTKFHVP